MENISLTQRIVGAIVILSLAIIFIPTFLETNKLDPGNTAVSPIPEVPREISTIVFQLNENNGKFEGEGLSASDHLTQKVTKALENTANEVEMAPDVEEKGVSEKASKRIERTGSAKKDQAEVANVTNLPKLSPTNIHDDGKQHSWMLQLASFKNEESAVKLRDSLRAKQYVANVDERKFSSGSIWRVRVGPVLSKDKIVKMQAMLEKETKLKGLIIRRR